MNGNNAMRAGGTLGMLALGALAGAAIAMLFAPRSGRDTRDYLARRARDLKTKAGETLADAKDRLVSKAESFGNRI